MQVSLDDREAATIGLCMAVVTAALIGDASRLDFFCNILEANSKDIERAMEIFSPLADAQETKDMVDNWRRLYTGNKV